MTTKEFCDAYVLKYLRPTLAGCLEWPFSKSEKGYGIVFDLRHKRTCRVHRLVWEAANGPTSEQVLHKCDNKTCANIEHLYAGSHTNNVQDALLRDRYKKGGQHYLSTLNEAQVVEILYWLAANFGVGEIARKYKTSSGAIKGIKAGKSWKHVLNTAL